MSGHAAVTPALSSLVPSGMRSAVEACRRNEWRAGREEAEPLPVHSSA